MDPTNHDPQDVQDNLNYYQKIKSKDIDKHLESSLRRLDFLKKQKEHPSSNKKDKQKKNNF